MAQVPVITSACPLRFAAMPSEGRDFCGQCQRRVHNLDGMSALQRREFLAGCEGKVCVAYTVNRVRRPSALQAGLAAVLIGASGAAFADNTSAVDAQNAQPAFEDVVTGPNCDPNSEKLESIMLTGGIDAATAQWVDEAELAEPDAPEIGEVDATEWLPSPPSDSGK
jgi:hypothetical protein